MKQKKTVSVLELKRLLAELTEHRPDICIRFRLIGQMWSENFLRVVRLTDTGVLLNDEISNKFFALPHLSQIMQFELDRSFQTYEPYYHYEVVPSDELK